MSAGRISTLPLPTPFGVGDINVYLVHDDPLTLVDTGPDWGRTLIALSDALAEHGLSIADIERVVLTHQHFDHMGLAKILVDRSGAEVCAIADVVPWLAEHDERMDLEVEFIGRLMRKHGVPGVLVDGLRSVNADRRFWGQPVTVTHTLNDGDLLPFAGRSWRVRHRPGHSPSDTIFHDERSGELFVGDHLVKHISSNALVTPSLDGDIDDAELELGSLRRYASSLRATAGLDAQRVYAGHGDVIDNPEALITRRLKEHEKRASRIESLLAEQPLTAFELAQTMWGGTAVSQPYLVISEVLGHMGLLLDSGRVRLRSEAVITRFERAA